MFFWRSGSKEEDPVPKILEGATRADREGRYQTAVDLYAKAIERLLAKLKEEQEPTRRQPLTQQINEYMTRAELLKAHLHKQKQKLKQTHAASRDNSDVSYSQVSRAHSWGDSRGPKPSLSSFAKKNDRFAHMILDEVLDQSPGVNWGDIMGLEQAKRMLQEAVIFPTLRPDLFTGLRAPPKGVLLFGPPGTGKTLLAKAVATEANGTFFNISASSLTSKWVGEGEKLVRALFDMARALQPSVIFMDEMDALLSNRSVNENDSSRRIKNQFFMELDGVASSADDRILVMGATNLPSQLDEALIRRMEKRIYAPLPDETSRKKLLEHLLSSHKYSLSGREKSSLVKATDGFSGSDLKALCKEAALGPIRELGSDRIAEVRPEDLRGINSKDFCEALKVIRPSVAPDTIVQLEQWNRHFGGSGNG